LSLSYNGVPLRARARAGELKEIKEKGGGGKRKISFRKNPPESSPNRISRRKSLSFANALGSAEQRARTCEERYRIRAWPPLGRAVEWLRDTPI